MTCEELIKALSAFKATTPVVMETPEGDLISICIESDDERIYLVPPQ